MAAALLYMVPKIGKDVAEAFEKIKGVTDEFLNENESPGDKMVEYLELIHAQQGGLYEYDVLTKLIAGTPLKEGYTKKALIVDDIDRLDPEHVFRILNVFAAHFDNPMYASGNKFNFDKIIIVCDINNIRNIFQHRYGAAADFMGYIDKFYSSDIFIFDNQRVIENTVEKIVYEVKPITHGTDDVNYIRQSYLRDDFVIHIVIILLRIKRLSFRNLLKIREKKIDFHYDKIYFDQSFNIGAKVSRVAYKLKLLTNIIGDVDHFIDAIKECRERGEILPDFVSFTGELFMAMTVDIHKMQVRNGLDYAFEHELYNISQGPGDRTPVIKTYESAGIFSTKEFVPSLELFWSAVINTCMTFKRLGT